MASLVRSRQRRHLLLSAGATLLMGLRSGGAAAADILAVRVWPSQDYTRITLEHKTETLRYTTRILENPLRFVIDLEDATLTGALNELTARIAGSDPYVQQVRVAQYQAKTVRIVFDLKQAVRTE